MAGRYSAKYEALLEEREPRVRDVFDVFWGAFKMHVTAGSLVRIVLVWSLVGALGAVAISFAAPKKYLSQTLISVETPKPQALDRYLPGLVKDCLSTEFMTSIIERENLFPRERARMPMNEVVDLARYETLIAPMRTSDGKPAFTIAFIYPDPHVAQRVDRELTSQFMLSALRTAIKNSSDPSRGQSCLLVSAGWIAIATPYDLWPGKPSATGREILVSYSKSIRTFR